jgi:IS5 family transposase
MAWKPQTQLSFADELIVEHNALLELDDINRFIDWTRIEVHLRGIYAKAEGNLAYAPQLMFKALLLQSWYALSDSALEKQLARDLLFRRFVGLNLSDAIPDHSTIWRYRQTLDKANVTQSLLNEVNAQLHQKGLLIKHGSVSIIDASVIEAQRARPNKDKDGNNIQDPEAAWHVKTAANGKKTSTYGYKAHINVDEDGFIKATAFSAGNIHDSQVFTSLLDDKDAAVYADSAYPSQAHSEWLAQRNIEDRMIVRAHRNKPLTDAQKAQNRLWSGTRCTVERTFGILKLHYGMAKARYLGLKRNAMRFGLMCIGYNMKRGLSLLRESMV